MFERVQKVIATNPHVAGDAGATIPTALVWLEQAPIVAALMTVLWFIYWFVRVIAMGVDKRKFGRRCNDSKKKT